MRMSLKKWLTSEMPGLSAKDNFLLREKRVKFMSAVSLGLIVGGAALVVMEDNFFFALLILPGALLLYFTQKYSKNLDVDYTELYLKPALNEAFGRGNYILGINLPVIALMMSGLFIDDRHMDCTSLLMASYKNTEVLLSIMLNYTVETDPNSGETVYIYSFSGIVLKLSTQNKAPCHFRALSTKYPYRKKIAEGMTHVYSNSVNHFDVYADKNRCGEAPALAAAAAGLGKLLGNRKIAVDWRGDEMFIAIDGCGNPMEMPGGAKDEKYVQAAERTVSFITLPVDMFVNIINN